MDIVTYKLSQKYADKVAAGFSSVRVDGLNIIFTLNDGKTATVAVPAPKDGVSIINVSLNQQNHLICTLSDGTAIDAGLVPQGVDGKDAKINGVNTLTIEAGDNITLDQEGNILTINSTGGGSGGTSNYNALTNKPKINNVELNGNKSLNDLGIQPVGNYALESDMTEVQNDIDHLSKVSNLFEKITATGTNITLNNTSDTIMKLNLDTTTSSQDSTTGKNLVPNTLASGSSSGITYTVNSDGSIKLSGTATARVEPYLYKDNNNPITFKAGTYRNTSSKIMILYADGYILAPPNQTFTLDEDKNVINIYFRIENGETVNETYYPQIILNSITDDTYEPYTGGQPAPSPSYPQTVHTITGDNSITISNNDNTQSQTYPINLGSMELCKIGDYQDILFKNTMDSEYYNVNLQLNKWYKYNNIRKTVLNGSENWSQWGPDTFYITKLSSVRTGLSNYYKYNSTATGTGQLNNGEFFIHDNTNSNAVIFRNTSYTTVADFKSWLSTHNTTLYYVLATPTYTLLNDTLQTQLDSIQYALAYDTQTNISQTNTDLPFIISAETYKEIDLTDYVKNTDYATFNKAGVIKSGYYLAVESGTGKAYAEVLNYNTYSNAGNNSFIGKGTLENVITGKELNLKQLSTFDSTKTQVLKNINGTLTWVDES